VSANFFWLIVFNSLMSRWLKSSDVYFALTEPQMRHTLTAYQLDELG
jgi:hypothetical protein